MKLLTTGNPKLEKGAAFGYLSSVLHLAPARLSGYQVCPMATEGCRSACLNTAGRGGMFAGQTTKDLTGADMVQLIKSGDLKNRIQDARIRRTRMFFENREAFMALLVREIESQIKVARKHNLTPVFRLNGTSDLRWETVGCNRNGESYPNVMTAFPDVTFYDYTKIPNRRNIPANYHLTFSLAESNMDNAITALINGLNVAAVFRSKPFPRRFLGRAIIDGDTTDLRFLDPQGVIVGLKAKGKAKKDTSGFVY